MREGIKASGRLNMKDKNHTIGKILVLIPAIIFFIGMICLLPLILDYFSSGSDVIAVAIIFLCSLFLIITPLPCLIMSILGTVFAAKAKKEGVVQAQKFFVLGVVELVIHGIGILGTVIALLVTIIAAYS